MCQVYACGHGPCATSGTFPPRSCGIPCASYPVGSHPSKSRRGVSLVCRWCRSSWREAPGVRGGRASIAQGRGRVYTPTPRGGHSYGHGAMAGRAGHGAGQQRPAGGAGQGGGVTGKTCTERFFGIYRGYICITRDIYRMVFCSSGAARRGVRMGPVRCCIPAIYMLQPCHIAPLQRCVAGLPCCFHATQLLPCCHVSLLQQCVFRLPRCVAATVCCCVATCSLRNTLCSACHTSRRDHDAVRCSLWPVL